MYNDMKIITIYSRKINEERINDYCNDLGNEL